MNISVIIISAIICLSIVVVNLIKPNIKIKNFTLNFYWAIALIGAIILLSIGAVSLSDFWNGLTASDGINPIQILILFLSMTMISIFLDEVGFFAHLANWVIKRTKSSQFKIFAAVYLMVSILTMFTSNDIIILTLTPFIIFFCKNAKVSPIPYLVSEFMAANTWSMIFIIGNPTNIFLATSFEYGFLEYFSVMALPTLGAGIVEFGLLLLIFWKKLKEPIQHTEEELPKEDKPMTIIGLSILFVCTIFLIISSYVSLPMYLIAAVSLGTLTITVLIYALARKRKPIEIGHTFIRAPWELVPFVISMFVIVMAISRAGLISELQRFYDRLGNYSVWSFGYTSFLAANVINNIPMSVLFTSIIKAGFYRSSCLYNTTQAVFASVIGSNIGAFLTPMGALAGIMWMGILKDHKVKYSFLSFVKYGAIVSIPVVTVALGLLLLVLSI